MAVLTVTCTCNYGSVLVSHDQRSCNRLIKQQVLNGNSAKAMELYKSMQELGFCADNFTYPILLKAVKSLSRVSVGLQLHGQAVKSGFFDHVYVQTSLMKMYSDMGCFEDARKVFDEMPVRDSIAWNSMLDGYASNGQMGLAIELFESIPVKDVSTYNIVVSGFAGAKRVESAREMFDKMPERDVISWNLMILACVNVSDMVQARALFEEAPRKSIVTWNTTIMGYLRNELYAEAIDLFEQMVKLGFVGPDYVTVTGALSASAHLRSLETGTKIDTFARNNGLVSEPHIITALIDMYSKCGSLENSLSVFYKSREKDIFCWNAMISGLALHGYGDSALKLLGEMSENGLKPDDITFIGLLSACSHSGLVKEGLKLFDSMEKDIKTVPKIEHYGCVVDLLSRAGQIEKAFEFVKAMPFEPKESVFGALLSGCMNQKNVEIGEKVIALIISKNETENGLKLSDSEYVMFANFYSSFGKWEEANRWRSLMNSSGTVKKAGFSAIEVNGSLSKFLAGEKCFSF